MFVKKLWVLPKAALDVGKGLLNRVEEWGVLAIVEQDTGELSHHFLGY